MTERYQELLRNLLSAAIAFVVLTAAKLAATYVINKIFERKIGKFQSRAKRYALLKKLIGGTVSALYWSLLAVAVLNIFGLGAVSTTLVTFAGIASLVVGLAAQDIFKDVIAGFLLITEDKLGHDDYVKVNGIEGVVEEIKLRNLYLRTYGGQLAIIPCGEIGTIVNFARGRAKAICELVIPFTEDIDAAKEAVLAAGRELTERNSLVLTSPVMAGVTEIGERGYRLRAYVETEGMEYWGVQRELNECVVKRLQAAGIRVAVPENVRLV